MAVIFTRLQVLSSRSGRESQRRGHESTRGEVVGGEIAALAV
jgi:hypothetical protein